MLSLLLLIPTLSAQNIIDVLLTLDFGISCHFCPENFVVCFSTTPYQNFLASLCLLGRGNIVSVQRNFVELSESQPRSGRSARNSAHTFLLLVFSIFLPSPYISCVSPSTPTETPVFPTSFRFVELSHCFPFHI